jgi:hypothetical protein
MPYALLRRSCIIFLSWCAVAPGLIAAASVDIGTNKRVTLSGANLNIHTGNASGFTLEFAVRPANNTGWLAFFEKSGAYSCYMWYNGFRLSINSPSGNYSFPDANISMSPNYWQRIAVQVSGNTARLFAGGAVVATVVRSGDAMPVSNTSSIVFGVSGTGWNGSIDEVRISNVARYDSAYVLSTAPFTADGNTMGLWHFDEGTGTTSADASGNGYTATLNGATWNTDFFQTGYVRTWRRMPVHNPSPFGVSIHLWNTRRPTLARWPRIPYDDGVNDGLCNSKIMKLIPDIGAVWVRDYGQSDGGSYWWKDDKGYAYMDSYLQTLITYNLESLHTNIGFSSEDSLRGKAPDDWNKFWNYQREAMDRYKSRIKTYKAGHEIDNTDDGRWTDTLRNYVRYLKYTYDAAKSVDPTMVCQIGDMARPVGGSSWNNGQFYYNDGQLNYVDESALDKILYEIVTNGTNTIYDTTSLGGFPGSRDPRDFLNGGLGASCYTGVPLNSSWIDSYASYIYETFAKYGVGTEMEIEIQENSALDMNPNNHNNTNALIPSWRYMFRTGLIGRAYYFHYDPISWGVPPGNNLEVTCTLVDFDANRDGQPDANITRYSTYFAYKKMTHLQYPNYEEFFTDPFTENGTGRFWETGWLVNNITGWSVSASTWNTGTTEFTGTAGTNPYVEFRDLALPTWQWRRWAKPNWTDFGLNRYFVVRMRTNQDSTASIQWDNVSLSTGAADFSDTGNRQMFPVTGDNQYREYVVDLGAHPRWAGVVAAVRFQPTAQPGATFAIDYLGFTNSSGAAVATRLAGAATPPQLNADGVSVATITAIVQDASGNPVTTSSAAITFTRTSGPGNVAPPTVVAVNGIARSYYTAGTSTGTAVITLTSPGLTQAQVTVQLVSVNVPPNAPANLRCNGVASPVYNLTDFTPDLSWTYSDPDGDAQGAYQVIVASTTADINANNGRMWSTGRVTGAAATVTYASANPLQPGVTYYWKVMVWDARNSSSAWSTVAQFTMRSNTPPDAPANLRCNGVASPVYNLDDFTPDLSWTFSDPDSGDTQAAYQVIVASVTADIAANIGRVWDSGRVNSSTTVRTYSGPTLRQGTTYYWKVRTWDILNATGAWSAVAQFTTLVSQNPGVAIQVTATPAALVGDGTSTSTVRAVVVDAGGIPVNSSTATITFSHAGPGSLVPPTVVQAVNGEAVVTYTAGPTSGTVTITATSPGLTQGTAQITLTAAPDTTVTAIAADTDSLAFRYGIGSGQHVSYTLRNSRNEVVVSATHPVVVEKWWRGVQYSSETVASVNGGGTVWNVGVDKCGIWTMRLRVQGTNITDDVELIGFIQADVGGQAELPGDSVQRVFIPANAASQNLVLEVSTESYQTVYGTAPVQATLRRIRVLSAAKADLGTVTLAAPARVRIRYPDENGDGVIDGTALAAADAVVARFDGAAWVPAADTFRDTASRVADGGMPVIGGMIALVPGGGLGGGTDGDLAVPPGQVRVQGGVSGYVVTATDRHMAIRFTPQRGGAVTLRIYNLRGALVWERVVQDVVPGTIQNITWDVRSMDGKQTPAGVYLLQVSGAGVDQRRRIAVVK